MTLEALFKKRQSLYLKNILKYARIIMNDHFVLILLILFGAGGFTYSNYLETVTVGMIQPRLLVGLLYLLIVSTGSLTLLLEPADKVFLLPKEQAFKQIFKRETAKSYGQSLFSVAFIALVTFPILQATRGASGSDFLWLLLTLAGLKWLNLLTTIAPFFEIPPENIQKYRWLTTAFKGLALLSLLFLNLPLTALVVSAVTLYVMYQFFTEKIFFQHFFQWETMIQAEEKRMQRLLRFIGLFTNVPNIETNIKRLSWLDPLLAKLSKGQTNAAYYYVLRVLVRNTDYSLLVLRATLVGGLLLTVTGSWLISAALVILFLYMIGFQLLTLAAEIERVPQFKIYPLTTAEKNKAIFQIIFQLLMVVSLLLGLAALPGLGLIAFGLWPLGFLFSYLFSYLYAPRRLTTTSE